MKTRKKEKDIEIQYRVKELPYNNLFFLLGLLPIMILFQLYYFNGGYLNPIVVIFLIVMVPVFSSIPFIRLKLIIGNDGIGLFRAPPRFQFKQFKGYFMSKEFVYLKLSKYRFLVFPLKNNEKEISQKYNKLFPKVHPVEHIYLIRVIVSIFLIFLNVFLINMLTFGLLRMMFDSV